VQISTFIALALKIKIKCKLVLYVCLKIMAMEHLEAQKEWLKTKIRDEEQNLETEMKFWYMRVLN